MRGGVTSSAVTVRSLLPVIVVGWLLRALPLVWSAPVFADEGVYYAASAWLWRGQLPYLDFVLVHPPGIVWLLAPVSWMEPVSGFTAARVLTTLVGALNILLVGRLGGAPAAMAYAVWPELVAVERGPALEPFLNCALLGMLNTRGWLSGGLAGLALSIKLWALPWFAILLLRRDWKALLVLPVATCALLAPFAGPDFVDQVFGFQATRPPDGSGLLARLVSLFHPQHLLLTLLALNGAIRTRSSLAIPWGLTWLAFLVAPGFWSRYVAFLALGTCLLVLSPRRWLLGPALGIALIFTLFQARVSDEPVPEGALGLDPAVSLRANRLPPIPDLYATMLRAGGSIEDPRAQAIVVEMLRDEPVIHVREPDREWLTPESEAVLGL